MSSRGTSAASDVAISSKAAKAGNSGRDCFARASLAMPTQVRQPCLDTSRLHGTTQQPVAPLIEQIMDSE